MAFAFPFIVRETTGPGRQIVLAGRSLPYQGVNWGGTQRVNINYFPGNPVASAQVIGQTYKPTVITGTWKDVFLLDNGIDVNTNAPRLFNFPNIGVAGLPPAGGVASIQGQSFPSAGAVPGSLQFANRARTVRDAFELIRRSGQLLRVEWGSIVRFGFLTDTNFTHDREEDIKFELEFSWTGDTDVAPKVRLLPTLDPLGLLKRLAALLQELLTTLTIALIEALAAVQRVTQQIRQLGALVTGLIEVLQRFAALALVPLELLGTIRQQLTAIALAARDLIAQLRATPAAYVSGVAGEGASAANLAAAFTAAIARNASILGATAIQQRRELERLEESNLLGLYISPGGVTLRDVATRFYGTPNNWPAIAEFNGFAGSIVPRGTVVRVPRVA